LPNAEIAGVKGRIELHTADITGLPFRDNSFDVIVSSLAIHNIPGHAGRRTALSEAARVLKPGGRLAIADLWEITSTFETSAGSALGSGKCFAVTRVVRITNSRAERRWGCFAKALAAKGLVADAGL